MSILNRANGKRLIKTKFAMPNENATRDAFFKFVQGWKNSSGWQWIPNTDYSIEKTPIGSCRFKSMNWFNLKLVATKFMTTTFLQWKEIIGIHPCFVKKNFIGHGKISPQSSQLETFNIQHSQSVVIGKISQARNTLCILFLDFLNFCYICYC